MSTRRDAFPDQVCTQLGKLHRFTRTSTRAHGEDALQQAFGISWRQFLALEDEPLGSGCVASVYKGHIFAGENAGKVVAVKVLHPGIKKTVQLDLELMRRAAEVLEHIPFLHLHWLSLVECVDQFASLMEMQMDLRQEAANLERFTKNFEDDPTILFPNPVYPWVHESVLTEDFLSGEPVSDFFPSKNLAHKGLQAFLKMAFLNNFVHGDLHVSVKETLDWLVRRVRVVNGLCSVAPNTWKRRQVQHLTPTTLPPLSTYPAWKLDGGTARR